MRALWAKAPFVLRHHPATLAAVVATTALASLAAASSPFIASGVRSESFRSQTRLLSPLAVGLELRTRGPVADDATRRAAAVSLGRTIPDVGRPVLASMVDAEIADDGLVVVAMSRTGAVDHVQRLTPARSPGVWISNVTAKLTGLRPGGTLRLARVAGRGGPAPPLIRLRVAGIYHRLDQDLANPYWANYLQDIRPRNPDSPPRPSFVLMSQTALARVSRAVGPSTENRFEFPVDPGTINYADAQRLQDRFAKVQRRVDERGSELATALGCANPAPPGTPPGCATNSSISAVLTIAARNVAAVTPTIRLLSLCGACIALGLAFGAGVFLVRRRIDEARLLMARGEATAAFATRSGLEAVLPAAAGAALGWAVAVAALDTFAARGTLDGATALAGAARSGVAGVAAVVCVAAGSALTFPRREARQRAGRLRRAPWEIVPLALAVVLLVAVGHGHGLDHDAAGGTHPSAAVFFLPVLAGAGIAGLAVRGLRRALGGRLARSGPAVFLAVRRLAAAHGLLAAVVVATAVSFGAFAYASTLSSSAARSATEKEYLANGSDVQGMINPPRAAEADFPFPAAAVQIDSYNFALASGERIDLVAGDPAALARTILWGDGWADDPRPLLPRLDRAAGDRLPALATPGTPSTDAIFDQGVRIPVEIVGHAWFPGTSQDRPGLLVSARALAAATAARHVTNPGAGAYGYLWARGPAVRILPAVDASSLRPVYLTTPRHIREDGSVAASERSYRYVRTIGVVLGVLALVALLLYLQARQRSQRIASSLARRMGLGAAADAAAVALEAATIAAVAVVTGAASAIALARPVVTHVDPLPGLAPSSTLVVPWTAIAVAGAATVVAAALLGAAAVALAARSDVAEAIRVG